MTRALWCLCFVLACSDDFSPSTLLEEPRVIGAELAVVGAPERPIPTSGESVDVRWLVESGDNDDFTWLAAACVAQPSPVGRPVCAEEPFFVIGSEAPTREDPTFRIDVPADMEPTHEVLMLGVLCPNGLPDVSRFANPRGFGTDTVCTEGEGQIVNQSLRSHVDAANTNPTWPAPAAFLDGVEWTAEECAEVAVGTTVEITLGTFPDSMRETYTRPTNDIPPREVELREVLLVSHLMTHGELSRQFSAFDGESEVRPVEWDAPETPPDGPVRFVFGLRDQRSGASFIERAICVSR